MGRSGRRMKGRSACESGRRKKSTARRQQQTSQECPRLTPLQNQLLQTPQLRTLIEGLPRIFFLNCLRRRSMWKPPDSDYPLDERSQSLNLSMVFENPYLVAFM